MSFTFPWRASTVIRSRINAYLDQASTCAQHFESAMRALVESRLEDVVHGREASHQAESAADDIRREIEQSLYEHELLPESRGDLLALLESMDHILGAMQGSLNILVLEKPHLEEFLIPFLRELTEVNIHAFELVRKAVEALMQDPMGTRNLCVQIDHEESRSDRIQQAALQTVFTSGLDLAQKLQIKDLIRMLGAISDRCEHTADLLTIIAIKRRI